jgi:kynureninase
MSPDQALRVSLAACQALDAADPFALYGGEFEPLQEDLIYLDGNSLGRPLKQSLIDLHQAANHQWSQRLIRSWNESWIDLPEQLGDKLADLMGAARGNVLVCDQTSVNLFKLAWAALDFNPDKPSIVTDTLQFPSDVTVLKGILAARGKGELKFAQSPDGIHGDLEALEAELTPDVGLICLSHTSFRTGFVWPMDEVEVMAADHGVLVLWDLSHSAGSVQLELQKSGAELAVGCTYKHLNGGPGAPAFLYVTRELQEELQSPIWGWLGHSSPFDFSFDHEPAVSIKRFFAGTPPILSMVPLSASLDLHLKFGPEAISIKMKSLTNIIIALADAWLSEFGVTVCSPRDPQKRGAHVSLRHPEARLLCQSLVEQGIIPDFRAPDLLRIGVTPLYTTWEEVWRAMETLRDTLKEGRHRSAVLPEGPVT